MGFLSDIKGLKPSAWRISSKRETNHLSRLAELQLRKHLNFSAMEILPSDILAAFGSSIGHRLNPFPASGEREGAFVAEA